MTQATGEIEASVAKSVDTFDTRSIDTLDPDRWAVARFWDLCTRGGLAAVAHREWKSPAVIDDLYRGLGGEVVAASGLENRAALCIVLSPHAVVYLNGPDRAGTGSVSVWAWAAARTLDGAKSILERIAAFLPPVAAESASSVPMTFWTQSAYGANSMVRSIAVPDWASIRANYSASTAGALDRLVAVCPPVEGGQLILFHGMPGTGKTHALRALAQAWRGWCHVHYLVDPERFFHSADYLLRVLIEGEEENREAAWRLLVAEDGDEFISVDAKERSGQALSRILNIVDGLIGQGLKVLLLVTTNEPIERLHPAVARFGRCLAEIHFAPLSSDEVESWLRAHGATLCTEPARKQRTLAELYAAVGGHAIRATKPANAIGFMAGAKE